MRVSGYHIKEIQFMAVTVMFLAALPNSADSFATPGSLDTTFDNDGIATTSIGTSDDIGYAVALQSDGKIVVAGRSGTDLNDDIALARYNSDGSLDITFDMDGKLTTPVGSANDSGSALAIQPDGKILAAGTTGSDRYSYRNSDIVLVRYNSDGSPDATFDNDGIVITDFRQFDSGADIALQPDGKIVIAGSSWNDSHFNDQTAILMRYNSNGSLDSTFDEDGILTASIKSGQAVAIQPDGKIAMAGWSVTGIFSHFALARYNDDGSLDATFDGDGIANTEIGVYSDAYAVAIQPDGKIIVAGESYNGNDYDFALVRYDTNGTLDTTFDIDGKVITGIDTNSDGGYAIAIQSDNKIIVTGWSAGIGADIALLRYNSDGSLDTTFDIDGIVTTDINSSSDAGYAVVLQPNGKIIVVGWSNIDTNDDLALVRYNNDGSLDSTFDNDGKVTTYFGSFDYGRAVAMQPDGKIVVAGESHQRGVIPSFSLARYNGDGSLDTGFGTDGKVTTSIGSGKAVAIQSDGKIVIAGTDGYRDFVLARYNSHGSLDATFDTDGIVTTDMNEYSDDAGYAIAI